MNGQLYYTRHQISPFFPGIRGVRHRSGRYRWDWMGPDRL
jgi:hypothetical protein